MNIYFSGIGGVGIGPLAQIAHNAGHCVTGSDPNQSLISEELKKKGIAISSIQDGSSLSSAHNNTPIDWFVYTAALPSDHPELVAAKQLGIRTSKRDEFLSFILKETGLKLIAVSGTHGKTTTTGMLVWAFKHLNIPVSYSIGTTISFGPSGFFDPQSDYFIYECDEFDKNFLNFSPHLALITSFDYDHPDTYPTKQSYDDAFHQFSRQSQHTILWQSDEAAIAPDAKKVTWLLNSNDILPVELPGIHNRKNATLAIKALEYLSLTDERTGITTLGLFPGTDRRFEKLADNIYSDYGHHPIEIAATLELASELSDNVTLVYQPHQNQRQHLIQDEYLDQFSSANKVYWLPTYLTREDPSLEVLSPQHLTRNISNKESIEFADLDQSLWQHVQNARQEGSLVLFMGAGTIDSWVREQLKR